MMTLPERRDEVQDLIEKAQAGDRAAFEDLVERHRARLRTALGFRVKESRRDIDLEDVLQDTFLRAFQAIRNFRWQGEGSFLRWLQGIGANVILKELGLHLRRKELKLERDVPTQEASPPTRLRRDERFDRLQEAIDRLSPDHRKVIVLARLEKMPIREIAKLMDRSPDAISHLLMRAVEKLRQSFGKTESLHLPDRRLRGDRGMA